MRNLEYPGPLKRYKLLRSFIARNPFKNLGVRCEDPFENRL